MSQFLDDLCFYCTERMTPPDDPKYQAAVKTLCALDDRMEQALGHDFVLQYDKARHDVLGWEIPETFREGLRFGVSFLLELQSSQVSDPSRFQAAFTSPQE